MQTRLLGEQQHGDRRQPRREPQLANPGEHARADDDDGRDLSRCIDIAFAGANVARDDERQRARDE
jgi:hypothetical protein